MLKIVELVLRLV